jgi:hypothetical protein
MLSTFIFFPFFGFGFVMYFLPSIIALARGKRDILAIFLLNLFLGWSVIGWVVALIWAAKHDAVVMVR